MAQFDYKTTKEHGAVAETILSFGKAVLFALGFTLVVFFVFALLLTYTNLSESTIPLIGTMTAVLGMMIAGGVFARTKKNRGYLNGGLTGVFYALLLYVLSILISGGSGSSAYVFVLLAIGLFGGAFGGILGINVLTKPKRH